MNSQELENYLKASSPEERIQALIEFYQKWTGFSEDEFGLYVKERTIASLQWAKNVVGEDGWREIPYAWMEETRWLEEARRNH